MEPRSSPQAGAAAAREEPGAVPARSAPASALAARPARGGLTAGRARLSRRRPPRKVPPASRGPRPLLLSPCSPRSGALPTASCPTLTLKGAGCGSGEMSPAGGLPCQPPPAAILPSSVPHKTPPLKSHWAWPGGRLSKNQFKIYKSCGK